MSAVPVLGPLPADSETSKTITKTEITKPIKSDPQEDEKSVTTITTEKAPKPRTTTIYDIYRGLLGKCPSALVHSNVRPGKNEFVPGTLKMRGTGFYYIQKTASRHILNFAKVCSHTAAGKRQLKRFKLMLKS
jgi:hypothetical protein